MNWKKIGIVKKTIEELNGENIDTRRKFEKFKELVFEVSNTVWHILR